MEQDFAGRRGAALVVGGNGGIDRGSAIGQHIDCCLGCQRMGCYRHEALGLHWGFCLPAARRFRRCN